VVRRSAVTLAAITLAMTLVACGDDGPDAGPEAAPAMTTTTDTNHTTTTTTQTTTTTEPEIEIPTGVLVAVPTQNREDPAKNQFQLQIHNGGGERYDLDAVQFVWDGFTTEVTPRDSIIVGGQVIDFPVPFPGAECVGDGTRQTMPSLDDAHVVLHLDDGATVDMPVVDKWHVARSLYEDDCEKQMIESQVAIEWVDLHEADFEGRPVTAGELRLTRREGAGEIAVLAVSNTIPFVFMAIDSAVGEPVVTLAADQTEASAPIRFVESRCDPHALAEIKQPTKFIAQIRLGDGSVHPYIIYPERHLWTPMRLTADKACEQLGKVVFVGD
jgi:predicted small lipoprotein YifL